MRLSSFFYSKQYSIIKRNFNLIEMNENVLMYSLLKIKFNFCKMNIIILQNIFEAHNERKLKHIIIKLILNILK